MRLPVVAMSGCFDAGIAFGLSPRVAHHADSRVFLVFCFVPAGSCILAGIALTQLKQLWSAATVSLLCWVLLGALAARIANQPRESKHILSLLDVGKISLKPPLAWHGHLHDEPTRLPWGYAYEISLSGVEFECALLPTTGGLRLSYTPHSTSQMPQELHAGDEIRVVTKAKLPPVFRDDGAFDRRRYLAQQNVDLVAALRSPELMERVSLSAPTVRSLLARARSRLRGEIDTLFPCTRHRQECCALCCSAIEVSLIRTKLRIFRRLVYFTCWWWLDYTLEP